MMTHFSKAPGNLKGWWYKPDDLHAFFKKFLLSPSFNIHEVVPERFKFFIDFDYKNPAEYLPDDVIIHLRRLFDGHVGSPSLLAVNKHDFKTGLHFVYPERVVSRLEAIQLITEIKEAHPEVEDYLDEVPYTRSLRTIFSVKMVGEKDYYVPCDGGRDAETMVRYSIYTHSGSCGTACPVI